MILSVDLGGTNARFAICKVSDNEAIEIIDQLVFKSKDFNSPAELFTEFANSLDETPLSAVVAVPGPVFIENIDSVARITNLPWTVKLSELRSALNMKEVTLVNDVAAAAAYLSVCSKDDYSVIHGTRPSKTNRGSALFLALGTGVGASQYIDTRDGSFSILPSEFGHCPAPLTSPEEMEFGKFLDSLGRMRSIEEAISGDGLENAYHFISSEKRSAAEIDSMIQQGNKQEAIDAFRLYQTILAKSLASLALAFSPAKGIFLGGGVSSKLAPSFDYQYITEQYLDFGELKHLREKIGLFQLKTENTGLIGAAALTRGKVIP